jgi:hypothetical protein
MFRRSFLQGMITVSPLSMTETPSLLTVWMVAHSGGGGKAN